MALHGKTVEKIKLERDETKASLEEVQGQLQKREADLEELAKNSKASEEFKAELEKIQGEYEEYKTTAAEREKEIKLNSALGLAIAKSGTVDEISLKANLNMESIQLSDDGSLKGLDEQIASIKETKPFLFGESANGSLPLGGAKPKEVELKDVLFNGKKEG